MRHAPGTDVLMRCTANALERAISVFYIDESGCVVRRRACVYRKPKHEHIGDAVRPEWRVNK